jgi:hypothetical protein
MGVSVPQQPTTSTLRVFFFLYVCFCFAISTVFQAFFVSYLVEPTYEKKLETLEELIESDVVFGSHLFFSFSQNTFSYPELVKFLEHKRLQEDCNDPRKCVERMITKRDMAAFISPLFATYVASDLGNSDVGKVICSLEEIGLSAGLIVLFKKGNVLVDRFNILMRSYLEAGLLERIWTELQHRASLRGGGKYTEAAGDTFFAFSVSHLMPAFVVLIAGTTLSSVVFIAELILNCLGKRRRKKIRAIGE